MSSVEYTYASGESPIIFDDCFICGEYKELTFLGECPCIYPHACFECYTEMYARYFVEMDCTLVCPFCRTNVGYNIFDPLNLAMVGLSLMDTPPPAAHPVVAPTIAPGTPTNTPFSTPMNNNPPKRKRDTEINNENTVNRNVRRRLFD